MKGESQMCDFFRKSAAVLLAIGLAVLTLAAVLGSSLPDSFFVENGSSLRLDSLFCVSAKPCKNDLAASANVPGRSSSTLMLFGSVPIKDVDTQFVQRPMLVPCGNPFGIKLMTDGVLVIGLQENCGKCAARESGIKKGDIIISIDGKNVLSNDDLSSIISRSGGKSCKVDLIRDGEHLSMDLTPYKINGEYKAGMWVRDSSAGIGTMTFYEKSTGIFGGLGHPICDADIKTPLPLSRGRTGSIKLNEFTRSKSGAPGWLSGDFVNGSNTGTIFQNCSDGVFGELYSPPEVDHDPIPLGFRQEVRSGEAEIYTSIDNSGPQKYSILISKVDLSGDSSHDFEVKVTDERLLEKTGGILQGMSGSPIIQDGKLIGAVTHVLVDKPECGYGIFADKMYEHCRQRSAAMQKAS